MNASLVKYLQIALGVTAAVHAGALVVLGLMYLDSRTFIEPNLLFDDFDPAVLMEGREISIAQVEASAAVVAAAAPAIEIIETPPIEDHVIKVVVEPKRARVEEQEYFQQPEAPPIQKPVRKPTPKKAAVPTPSTPSKPVKPQLVGREGKDDRPLPRIKYNPPAAFPYEAARRGQFGVVHLSVQVGVNGAPLQIKIDVSSGHPILDATAVRMMRRWRFHPAIKKGRPVASSCSVRVSFSRRIMLRTRAVLRRR